MKTYLLNAVQRLKNYSQKLDAQAILYDKSWEVFNESGDKELMIFRANNELLISRNGIIQKGKWELLDISNLIIDVGEKSYLLNAAYIEDQFLALKLDGTEQYMVMIEADMKNRFSLNTVKSIEGYLDDRYKKIEQKRIRKEKAEQKRIESELRVKELIKKREEEEEILRQRAEKKEQERIRLQEEERRRAEEEGRKRLEEIHKQETQRFNRYIKYNVKDDYFKATFKLILVSIIFLVVFVLLIMNFQVMYLNSDKGDKYETIFPIAISVVIALIFYLPYLISDWRNLRDPYKVYKARKNAGTLDDY